MKSLSEELQKYLTSLNYVNLYNSKPNFFFTIILSYWFHHIELKLHRERDPSSAKVWVQVQLQLQYETSK